NKMRSGVMEDVKRLFKPEFINRIDEIMVFHPLTEQDMKQIVSLLSRNLCERCRTQMDIDLSFTNTLREYLVKKYSDLKMGARPLKRAIQNVVENELATAVLEGRVQRGDTVTAGVRGDKVTFTVK
ncbi:MAG: ATP-dependent Clp protease ATP-binding subunit ClpC, partial [Lachnospiraceae bacterium]|nr:ATP-dependent Clp protease ATP-binding subunit ClpC [Lachnospiraceae bacterium]